MSLLSSSREREQVVGFVFPNTLGLSEILQTSADKAPTESGYLLS